MAGDRIMCIRIASFFAFIAVALGCASVRANDWVHPGPAWEPEAPRKQVPLWPEGLAIARPPVKGPEGVWNEQKPGAPAPLVAIVNVSRPTMTVYPPKGKNSGATMVVFPGGGYRVLAIELEGTQICDAFTAKGMTCVVLKYRVPGSGPWWSDDCNCGKEPTAPMALQDAQRTMVLLRHQAKALQIDPQRIGVIGFSAGGHMVADISNHPRLSYKPVDDADKENPVPDFAIAMYAGHLWDQDEHGVKLHPRNKISTKAPPTFIVQAQNDLVDDVRNSVSYYLALTKAGVPVEMHLYAKGGHAFALRKTTDAIGGWPALLDTWLHGLGVLTD